MTITAAQVRAARALLNWSRVKLAVQCDLPYMRVAEFETGKREARGPGYRWRERLPTAATYKNFAEEMRG